MRTPRFEGGSNSRTQPRHPSAQHDYVPLLIALLLWFFLGGFGAHRFFLGHTSSAVAMLILGIVGYATICIGVGIVILIGVGVWVLIDLVLILTGSLSFADGRRLMP